MSFAIAAALPPIAKAENVFSDVNVYWHTVGRGLAPAVSKGYMSYRRREQAPALQICGLQSAPINFNLLLLYYIFIIIYIIYLKKVLFYAILYIV